MKKRNKYGRTFDEQMKLSARVRNIGVGIAAFFFLGAVVLLFLGVAGVTPMVWALYSAWAMWIGAFTIMASTSMIPGMSDYF